MVDTKRIKGEEKAVFVPTNADIYEHESIQTQQNGKKAFS